MTKLYLSAPYPEGAIMRLATAAPRNKIPTQIFQSALPAALDAAYHRIRPGHRSPRKHVYSEEQNVLYLNGLGEIAKLALRIIPRQEALRSSLMYTNAIRFDSRVAQALIEGSIASGDVLLGMPGASLDTFAIAKSRGATTVLHMVNGHPRVHNETLRNHCALPLDHHEYVPPRIETRVQQELTLSDLVLAPSSLVQSQLTRHGIDETKIRIIPYGVDTSAFRATLRKRETTGPLKVLYVGQISYRKGVHLLLQAARLLPSEVAITLVGPIVSPDILQDTPSNVAYLGPQSRVQIAALMQGSSVFVLPSLEDACALVTAEALSSGCPVVTTTGNGSHVLIEDNVNGLVLHDVTPLSLAEAITKAAFISGRAVRKYVDWETYTSQVLDELGFSLDNIDTSNHG